MFEQIFRIIAFGSCAPPPGADFTVVWLGPADWGSVACPFGKLRSHGGFPRVLGPRGCSAGRASAASDRYLADT